MRRWRYSTCSSGLPGDPRMAGVEHTELPAFWLFETPQMVARVPRLTIVYTIDDAGGFADLWNLYRL